MINKNTINEKFKTLITSADNSLSAMKFTEHNLAHVCRVAQLADDILLNLGYDEHTRDLARTASLLHDIGNIVNRQDHAHSGAILAFKLLQEETSYSLSDISAICSAIGNHDESSGVPVSPISAALIIADKADIRRSRVRNKDVNSFNIHDKVNYSVFSSNLQVKPEENIICLNLGLDTDYSSVMDYFSIFLDRMVFCKKAANYLNMKFCLYINNVSLTD